jgi:dolichyl-phosphate beta-glucosyltransferase
MNKNKLILSLIIPVYNEQKILAGTLDTVIKFLKGKKYDWEIVVADDGSRDSSAAIAKKYSSSGVRLVRLQKNQGKGAALRAGMLSAKGNYKIFTDCDLSVPVSFINNFMNEMKAGSDVVIGSRRTVGSKIEVHQPLLREVMGRVYTFLTQFILNMFNISDFTCGFKGFTKSAAFKIFSNSKIDRWAYDSELLFLGKIYGFKIGEVPVSWQNRADTRVVLKKVILESFSDLLKIKVNYLTGKYKT